MEWRKSHHLDYQYHPPGFAAWSTPRWAIVSGGQRDRLEFVATAYQEPGSRVLHTAESGAIHVAIVDGQLSVDSWRPIVE